MASRGRGRLSGGSRSHVIRGPTKQTRPTLTCDIDVAICSDIDAVSIQGGLCRDLPLHTSQDPLLHFLFKLPSLLLGSCGTCLATPSPALSSPPQHPQVVPSPLERPHLASAGSRRQLSERRRPRQSRVGSDQGGMRASAAPQGRSAGQAAARGWRQRRGRGPGNERLDNPAGAGGRGEGRGPLETSQGTRGSEPLPRPVTSQIEEGVIFRSGSKWVRRMRK